MSPALSGRVVIGVTQFYIIIRSHNKVLTFRVYLCRFKLFTFSFHCIILLIQACTVPATEKPMTVSLSLSLSLSLPSRVE